MNCPASLSHTSRRTGCAGIELKYALLSFPSLCQCKSHTVQNLHCCNGARFLFDMVHAWASAEVEGCVLELKPGCGFHAHSLSCHMQVCMRALSCPDKVRHWRLFLAWNCITARDPSLLRLDPGSCDAYLPIWQTPLCTAISLSGCQRRTKQLLFDTFLT